MRQKAACLIFLFSVLRFVTSQYGCFMNEVYTANVNPCSTCEIRGYCPQYSAPGCDCFPSYLRNSQGICVSPETCDGPYNVREYTIRQQCGPNEEYNSCGSACPPTCKNPRPEVCTLQCVSGCFCRGGLIRKDGRCVPPEACSIPIVPVLTRVASPVPYGTTSKPTVTRFTKSAVPVKPTSAPANNPRGCPNRIKCNRYCRGKGSKVGFCIGQHFRRCNCMD